MLKLYELFWDALAYLFTKKKEKRNHHILKESDEMHYFVDLFCNTESHNLFTVYSKVGLRNIQHVYCRHWN